MGTNHRGYIRGELLAEYLREIATHDPRSPKSLIVNKEPLSKRQARRLYSWEHEASNPSFWSVDNFLAKLELHIDLFLNWCYYEKEESPWAGDQPPSWWERAAA